MTTYGKPCGPSPYTFPPPPPPPFCVLPHGYLYTAKNTAHTTPHAASIQHPQFVQISCIRGIYMRHAKNMCFGTKTGPTLQHTTHHRISRNYGTLETTNRRDSYRNIWCSNPKIVRHSKRSSLPRAFNSECIRWLQDASRCHSLPKSLTLNVLN
jgi:hypothetical protein